MTESFSQFGFSAGVLAPEFYARGDLQKYSLGLADARNFIIDYLGGARSRPGTKFLDVAVGSWPRRIFAYNFNRTLSNTYLCLFTDNQLFFLQDGAYVLNAEVSCTYSFGTVTAAAHGLTSNDYVRINGRTFGLTSITANTFRLVSLDANSALPAAVSSFSSLYRVSSPYPAEALRALRFDQDKDVVYINSADYPEYKLIRYDHTNWTLTQTPVTISAGGPASLTITPSAAGTAGVVYAVTAVDVNGVESAISAGSISLSENIVNFTATAGTVTVSWPKVSGAVLYRIYRGAVGANGLKVDFGPLLGLLGETRGLSFTDNNYIPDYTKAPIEIYNPFTSGAISRIEITSGGSGYNKLTATVSITGGSGSGFVGKPIVDETGQIVGVLILNPGSGYSSPVVTFSAGGATATAEVQSGIYPITSTALQQRRIRAGAMARPGGIWGSRVGNSDSYNRSGTGTTTDPFELDLEMATATPIRHIRAAQDGFFLFTDEGIWQVRGVDDSIVSESTAKSLPQTEEGCGELHPLRVEKEYLYLHSTARSVHSLRPSNLPTYFTVVDASIFSPQFFPADNPIIAWAWAKSPFKLVWAVRRDGSLLTMTFVPEQEVMAWSNHTSNGLFRDVAVIRENSDDTPYFLVEVEDREFISALSSQSLLADGNYSLDLAVVTPLTPGPGTLTYTAGETTVTGSFSSGDVGKIIRFGAAKAEITSVAAGVATLEFITPFTPSNPDITFAEKFTEWYLNEKFTVISALFHLEGKEVIVLGDGVEFSPLTVVNGSITLPIPVSFAIVGLPYTGRLKTLPLQVDNAAAQAVMKNVKGLAVRMLNSRGLRFGDSAGDILYPLQEAADTAISGLYRLSIRAAFEYDGSIVVEKVGAFPAHILGLVREVAFGQT